MHIARRGSGYDAAQPVPVIIATHDQQARTAHDIAAEAQDPDQLPDRVRRLYDRRIHAVQARRAAYRNWCAKLSSCSMSGSAGLTSISAAAATRASTTASTSS